MTAVRGRRSLIAGVLAGIASFAAAIYADSTRANTTILFSGKPAETVPIPAELLPAGTAVPPAPQPLTAAQRARLHAALWQDPLDQRLVNLLYVQAVRANGLTPGTLATARTLGRLGWRHTPAQQNLMMGAALDGRFSEVVDRVDALLRRQKLTAQAMAMLMAMEAIPKVHGLVVDKLLGDPMWRHDYLLRIAPQTPAPVLDARLRTMQTLLRSPDGAARDELSPILQALVATGRGRAAYDLWALKAGRPKGGNLVRDPRFQFAARTAGEGSTIPFEWRFNQSLGYSADAGPQGATINWDGRGVPVFMNQLVPVEPGRSYLLTIAGRTDSGKLQDLLAPVLGCGQVTVTFAPVGESAGATRFRSAPVPQGCSMAELALGGSVDVGTRAAIIDVGQVTLQRGG